MESEMSTMSQTGESTGDSAGKQQTDEQEQRLTVVALIVCCLLITALLALAFLVISNTFGSGDGGDGDQTVDPGVYVVDKGRPTIPPTIMSTLPTLPASTTTTPRSLPPFTLICTVHFDPANTKWTTPPDDKMCDFIYYDSLYDPLCEKYEKMNITIPKIWNQDILEHLSSTVYTHTRIGLSIELVRVDPFRTRLQTAEGKKEIAEYNAVGIRDWGFLNVNRLHMSCHSENYRMAFSAMKEIAEFQATLHVESYLVLGIYLENQTVCEETADLMNAIFTPHGIISLGHTSHGCTFTIWCLGFGRTIPANPDFDPDIYRQVDLKEVQYLGGAVGAVKCLRSKGVNTMFAVSLTLAYIYTSDCGRGQYSLGRFFFVCRESYMRREIQKDCSNIDTDLIDYDEDFHSYYYLPRSTEMTAFDTVKSLKYKACNTWENTKDLGLGLSIYDINFDTFWQNGPGSNASHISCSAEKFWDGEWARTKYLLKFRDFLKNEYTNPGNQTNFHDRCNQVS